MHKYTNPADKLIQIASHPKQALGPDACIVQLAEFNRQKVLLEKPDNLGINWKNDDDAPRVSVS